MTEDHRGGRVDENSNGLARKLRNVFLGGILGVGTLFTNDYPREVEYEKNVAQIILNRSELANCKCLEQIYLFNLEASFKKGNYSEMLKSLVEVGKCRIKSLRLEK